MREPSEPVALTTEAHTAAWGVLWNGVVDARFVGPTGLAAMVNFLYVGPEPQRVPQALPNVVIGQMFRKTAERHGAELVQVVIAVIRPAGQKDA